MDAATNVEYGLRVAGARKDTRRTPARRALAMVRLEEVGSRRSAPLSGGQRQRVARARPVVNVLNVLLLDEPLVTTFTAGAQNTPPT